MVYAAASGSWREPQDDHTGCARLMQNRLHEDYYFLGCLLGGAVGDALGAPIEFMSTAQIRERFGSNGLVDYAPAYGRLGAITETRK